MEEDHVSYVYGTGNLHKGPCPATGEVEDARFDGRFALRVEGEDPLGYCDLCTDKLLADDLVEREQFVFLLEKGGDVTYDGEVLENRDQSCVYLRSRGQEVCHRR